MTRTNSHMNFFGGGDMTLPVHLAEHRRSIILNPLCSFRRLVWAVLILAALPAPVAMAQEDGGASQMTVANRPRPDWEPAGIGVGGFLVFPSVELGLANDDNIYRLREAPTRDIVRAARPRIFGVSRWSRHEIELDAGLDASSFEEADDEDVRNWFLGAGGRFDIGRDTWVRAQVNMRELHEERGDPESPATALRPVSRRMSGVQVEAFRRMNRLTVGLEGSYTDVAFDDTVDSVTGRPLIQNDRDRAEREVSARLGWKVASASEMYLRATRYSRRYDRPQGEDRYLRDSDGTEAVLGSRLELGAVLAVELFAGYRSQSYDRDERLPDVDGLGYGGVLTWNVTPLTTVRGTVSRTVNESALRQASGYLSSSWEIGLDHELRRNVLIGADVSVTTNSYEGIEREDDIVTSTIRVTWKFNRTVSADFGYRGQRRDSTVRRDDYAKNYVFLDVRLSL